MTQKEFNTFSAELTKTAESFGSEMTPGRIATYFEDLSDLSLEAVLGALQYARRTYTFFPKIAELRRYAEGSADDRAELAWRTFLDLVKFEGEYPSLQVYDGGIAYAIEQFGGWQTACAKLGEASPEMVANYEKGFKNSYKLGSMRNEGPRYLVGQTEANNRGLGAWKSPTVEQLVCLVRPGQIVRVVMPLDLAEGRLTAEARKALEDGGNAIRKYLPLPPKPAKALPPVSADAIAKPEEVAEEMAKVRRFQGTFAPSSRDPQPKRANVVNIIDRKGGAE